MGTILNAFKSWRNRRNIEGLVLLLSKSKSSQVTLQTYQRYIDNGVVEALNDYSYYMAKTKGIEEGLKWIEIAHQASLLGGDAESLAECFITRALILYGEHEEKRNDTTVNQITTGSPHPLIDAVESALQSLQIYREIEHTEKVAHTFAKISGFYQEMDKPLQAFEYRLLSILSWAKLADVADVSPPSTAMLVGLYWNLKGEELQQGALLLLKSAEALELAVTRWIGEKQHGDLCAILGSACRETDHPEQAFQYWEQAVRYYRQSTAQKDEFLSLARMQNYAVRLEQGERAIVYGEACISAAPPDTKPEDLASRHRILAFLYAYVIPGRELDAVSALHRAAELFSQNQKTNYAAGNCLLLAATIEEELGMIDETLRDLEKSLTFPGTINTRWFACQTLARLWWRQRGDLGMALKYATNAEEQFFLTLSLPLRAVTLWLSGNLFSVAGDAQRAADRFDASLKILTTRESTEQIITLHVDPLFDLYVPLPSKAEVTLAAFLTAQKSGRKEDAQRYMRNYNIYREQNKYLLFQEVYGEFTQHDEKLESLLRGMKLLAKGEEFALLDPKQAIGVLEEALSLLADQEATLVRVYRLLGQARLRLRNAEGAHTAFNQALLILSYSSDAYEEGLCRFGLGIAESAIGNMELAYEQIDSALKLTEIHRTNLTEDQRLSLLENYLYIYTLFLGICIRLHLPKRALETVELVKSRVFVDLLAQPQRRVIDYHMLSEIRELKSRREGWMLGESLLETWSARSEKFKSIYEEDPEKAVEWFGAPINLVKHAETLEKSAQSQQLHLKLESQAETLTFDAICALCRAT